MLFIVIGTGFVALSGNMKIEKQHNFENIFEGTTRSPSAFCLGVYNVYILSIPISSIPVYSLQPHLKALWSFTGFSNVNYALSEVKNPARTIRIAGPLALGVVTVLYMFANVAYFAGASKEEITNSGRLVAALLFKNVYGPKAERFLSFIVALSALGNVLSIVRTLPMQSTADM